MTNQQLIIAKLKAGAMDTVKEAILDLIEDHDRKRLQKLQDYYDGKHDILKRPGEPSKPNNRIVNDFPGEIVDTAVGYFIGIPVAYKSDDDAFLEEVNRIRFINDEELHNERLVVSMCTQGRSYELLYIDENSEPRFMWVPATEMILVYDGSAVDQVQYALRYYPIIINGMPATKIELYDAAKVVYYILERNVLRLDDSEPQNPRPHYFGDVPVVEYRNNEAGMGDFEKVTTLVDEYNRHMSDVANEHEYFRNAYLLLRNLSGTDSEDLEAVKHSGAFLVDEDGDVKFITKDINDDAVEHHYERLDENIHKFSKTPDLTDESFGGNLSGVAIKYKILELETKCISKERRMLAGLRRRWTLISNILNIKGHSFEPDTLRYEFRRNLPSNIQEEADAVNSLHGRISDETLFGMLSFVDDPQAEMERIKEERKGFVDLDGVDMDGDI